MDKKMMQCLNFSCPERNTCAESKPHTWTKWCDVSGYYGQKTDVLCPKCIDITCKSCDGKGYATLPYVEPSPAKDWKLTEKKLQAEKSLAQPEPNIMLEAMQNEGKMRSKPQPEPMPLKDSIDLDNPDDVDWLYEWAKQANVLIGNLPVHDQQVRKDLIEECLKSIPSIDTDIEGGFALRTIEDWWESVQAHLRAMAGER